MQKKNSKVFHTKLTIRMTLQYNDANRCNSFSRYMILKLMKRCFTHMDLEMEHQIAKAKRPLSSSLSSKA